MRAERISASASCSKSHPLKKLRGAVAAACLAAALFFNGPAAAMTIEGVPKWLEPHVLRGLSAVWDEMPPGEERLRLKTLSVVTQRLFTGYDATVSREQNAPFSDPHVLFKAKNPVTWKIDLTVPDLRPPIASWFERDVWSMREALSLLLENLPVESLSWADSALRDRIGALVELRLPGWNFALLVRLEADKGIAVLQVSFHAKQPLVLALTPSIFSSTLPVMLQSDLTAKLLLGLSPMIGLPVEWVAWHRADVELLAQDFLEERHAISNTRSQVTVSFVPEQLSKVDVTVNSDRFIFQIWLAAYSGIKGRYPEMGILLGWNMKQWTGIGVELYNETIIDVGEFGFSNRLGFRFPLWRQFRVGVELELPEREVWYRAQWDSERIRRFYMWWRYNAENGHNAAVGYRINEHISIEVHYDNRYNEKVGLKGILLL